MIAVSPTSKLSRVTLPILESSADHVMTGDDLCRTMVPCGGLVPRSLSDPGPHLLAEDAATTTPARTGSPFVSAPWSGFFDCAPQEVTFPTLHLVTPRLPSSAVELLASMAAIYSQSKYTK